MAAGSVGQTARTGALVFVDIETTGGSYKASRVLEVGAVRVEGGRVTATYKSLINPGEPVPSMITRLTGIRDEDVSDAPKFADIADELADILEGAVFIAHNVQFDYGFLRMEFERLGASFKPKLLCTVRLSRRLYPEAQGHKLQDLIDRYGFYAPARHRAYDDANVLWQFFQQVLADHDLDSVDEALAAQLKVQSLPSNLDAELVAGLPEGPGVYIFEDAAGAPLYVGKSIGIRKRVMSHFTDFHDRGVERRIAADIRHIRAIETYGELGALLTESRLVKELQPLHNRRLRKHERLTLGLRELDEAGYMRIRLTDADTIDPTATDNIMAVFTTSGRARESLHVTVRNFYLCPRLMGLEKGKGACFGTQLKKCHGACGGDEAPTAYNDRFLAAFDRQRLHGWPYAGPILITETTRHRAGREGLVFDQWCLKGRFTESPEGEVVADARRGDFDLDQYKILRQYLSNDKNARHIRVLSPVESDQLEWQLAAA